MLLQTQADDYQQVIKLSVNRFIIFRIYKKPAIFPT